MEERSPSPTIAGSLSWLPPPPGTPEEVPAFPTKERPACTSFSTLGLFDPSRATRPFGNKPTAHWPSHHLVQTETALSQISRSDSPEFPRSLRAKRRAQQRSSSCVDVREEARRQQEGPVALCWPRNTPLPSKRRRHRAQVLAQLQAVASGKEAAERPKFEWHFDTDRGVKSSPLGYSPNISAASQPSPQWANDMVPKGQRGVMSGEDERRLRAGISTPEWGFQRPSETRVLPMGDDLLSRMRVLERRTAVTPLKDKRFSNPPLRSLRDRPHVNRTGRATS